MIAVEIGLEQLLLQHGVEVCVGYTGLPLVVQAERGVHCGVVELAIRTADPSLVQGRAETQLPGEKHWIGGHDSLERGEHVPSVQLSDACTAEAVGEVLGG